MYEVAGIKEKLQKVNRQVQMLVQETSLWLGSLNSAHNRIDRLKCKVGDLSALVDSNPSVLVDQEDRIAKLEDEVARWRGEVLALKRQMVTIAEVGAQNALNLRQHVSGIAPEKWSKAELVTNGEEPTSSYHRFSEVVGLQGAYANLECGHDILSPRVINWHIGERVRCPICEEEARPRREPVLLKVDDEEGMQEHNDSG